MKKFRFRGDRSHVKIANLSGGEKARLAIVGRLIILIILLMFIIFTSINYIYIFLQKYLLYYILTYEIDYNVRYDSTHMSEVRMMLIPSRMLIFDEPTNHLDVAMKET